MSKSLRYVAVVGGSSCTEKEAELATQVGRLLAEEQVVVICGGRGGVMEAVSKGCSEAGGTAIGILPGLKRKEGNKYLTFTIPTGIGHARNAIVTLAGQAVIAIGGGPGTLSEIALALAQGRSVIALGSWRGADSEGVDLQVFHVDSAEEAVAKVLEVL